MGNAVVHFEVGSAEDERLAAFYGELFGWGLRGFPPGAPVTWFEVMGSDAARTQRFYAELFGWTVDSSAFPGYATVDTCAGQGIQGGLGGGEESRWATIYAKVDDVDQTLGRVETLGGSRIADPGVPALKAAARAAVYGSAGAMKTGAFRDPSGNVFGIYSY